MKRKTDGQTGAAELTWTRLHQWINTPVPTYYHKVWLMTGRMDKKKKECGQNKLPSEGCFDLKPFASGFLQEFHAKVI